MLLYFVFLFVCIYFFIQLAICVLFLILFFLKSVFCSFFMYVYLFIYIYSIGLEYSGGAPLRKAPEPRRFAFVTHRAA